MQMSWWRYSPPGCAQGSYAEGNMSACPLFLVHFLPAFLPLLCALQSKAENAKRGNVQELDFSWACGWFCGLPVLMLSVWLHLRRIPVKHRVPTCLWWRTQSAIWAWNLSQTILIHHEYRKHSMGIFWKHPLTISNIHTECWLIEYWSWLTVPYGLGRCRCHHQGTWWAIYMLPALSLIQSKLLGCGLCSLRFSRESMREENPLR